MKKRLLKMAVGWFVVPALRSNAAARLILETVARCGTWKELMEAVARLMGWSSYLELLDESAAGHLRQVVDAHDGPDNLGVALIDSLLEPFAGDAEWSQAS